MKLFPIAAATATLMSASALAAPLDPAPVSMIETVINYKPEYLIDESGKIMGIETGEH